MDQPRLVQQEGNMSPTIDEFLKELRRRGACATAVAWFAEQPDMPTAWEACQHADWLLWIATRRGTSRNAVVRAACACARTALKYVPKGENRPLRAIETAEAWANGRASSEEARDAYAVAYAYTAGAAAYAACAAAKVAAYASYAMDAADAATYGTYAVHAVEGDDDAAMRHMANLVREHISFTDVFGG